MKGVAILLGEKGGIICEGTGKSFHCFPKGTSVKHNQVRGEVGGTN